MSRTMLINAERAEELRVAVVEKGVLESYRVDVAQAGLCRGNIYRGVVVNVQRNLNAAFVDFGAERHGFLAGHDVVPQSRHKKASQSAARPKIDEILEPGKPILVQVTKDAVGTKGAALTTNVSLAGRYFVLMPYDSRLGLSRKVEDEVSRDELRKRAGSLKLPAGFGFIVRTNAMDQTQLMLKRDLATLVQLWKRIWSDYSKSKGPILLYNDQDLIVQALRDYIDPNIREVLVDDEEAFKKAKDYKRSCMARSKVKINRYDSRIPLFSKFDLELQIDAIYQRKVPLPGGGSIVIDVTEALTAIDVNSGKTKQGTTQEETILKTNLEAAEAVARQIRLRDIGGLLVVDFIDMRASQDQRAVEKTLREAMKSDKARFSVGSISRNGLLEINRQQITASLQTRTHRPCPTCKGTGLLASAEQVGLGLLRRIEARAAIGQLKAVRVAMHPELADAVQNRRRKELAALEQEFDIQIEIIAASHLHRSDEQIEWVNREIPPPQVTKPVEVAKPEKEPSAKRSKWRGRRRRRPKLSNEKPVNETPRAE
ncbi:MAG: Rne/Rng family ribonuclease [Pseudomonadota bacterium]